MTDGQKKILERREKILESVRTAGYASVGELSALLGVTPVTVRSDLSVLESQGRLTRTQGGALSLNAGRDPDDRSGIRCYEEKLAIARAASAQIPEGSTLFINAGTTTLLFARALKEHRNLHIVTNSYAVASELGGLPGIRVVLLGGELDAQFSFTTGDDAQEQLRRYQADRAILSVDGISPESGLTTYHVAAAALNRMMSERARSTTVLADHTKIGRPGFSHVCALRDGLTLITDAGADTEELKRLECAGLSILAV